MPAESFVPLQPTSSAASPLFEPLDLKLSKSPQTSNSENPVSHSGENCASPKVTLQRENEMVMGIRVECGCGQVIELTCVY